MITPDLISPSTDTSLCNPIPCRRDGEAGLQSTTLIRTNPSRAKQHKQDTEPKLLGDKNSGLSCISQHRQMYQAIPPTLLQELL
jgi:hypothetical protein